MTFKKLIGAGLAGLAALAVAVLLIDPSLAQTAAPAAAGRCAAAPALVVNKGDNAWMLTSTVLVLLMTIPGLALFYGGLVRPKNMLSVLTHVFYTVCIVTLIWVIYGYSLAFTGGSPIIGGLDKLFLKGVTADSQAATFSVGVTDPRVRLHLLPDDVRGDHAGADRRRLCRAHEVLGGGAVHPAVGDASSTSRSRTWSGTGPARTRSTPPPRLSPPRPTTPPRRPRRPSSTQSWPTPARSSCGARSTSPAAPWCTSTPASPVSSARSCVGKRIGFGKELMPPHSLVMTMIGASLLWVGWFGFNAGSNLEANRRRARSP